MLTHALIQIGAALQLIPPGAAPPVAFPPVADTSPQLVSPWSVDQWYTSPAAQPTFELSREEFEHMCEIREIISGAYQPLSDSGLLEAEPSDFRQALLSDYDGERPAVDPPPQPRGKDHLKVKLRNVSERLDAAASRLERRQLYESADELRELGQQLRAEARGL